MPNLEVFSTLPNSEAGQQLASDFKDVMLAQAGEVATKLQLLERKSAGAEVLKGLEPKMDNWYREKYGLAKEAEIPQAVYLAPGTSTTGVDEIYLGMSGVFPERLTESGPLFENARNMLWNKSLHLQKHILTVPQDKKVALERQSGLEIHEDSKIFGEVLEDGIIGLDQIESQPLLLEMFPEQAKEFNDRVGRSRTMRKSLGAYQANGYHVSENDLQPFMQHTSGPMIPILNTRLFSITTIMLEPALKSAMITKQVASLLGKGDYEAGMAKLRSAKVNGAATLHHELINTLGENTYSRLISLKPSTLIWDSIKLDRMMREMNAKSVS